VSEAGLDDGRPLQGVRPLEGEAASRPADSADSIARNTAFGLATQLTTAAFTAALTLYLVRALGTADYGVFALAIGVGGLVLMASDLGISASAGRFIAERRGDHGAVAAVLGDAFRLKLIVSAVACAALFATAGPIADAYGNGDLAWPLRAVAIAVFGHSMLLLYRGSFIAMGRVSVTWRIIFLESAMEAGATIALVLAGGGAAGAVFGRAIGYVFGALIGVLLALRIIGRRSLVASAGSPGRRRQIVRYAGALLVVNAAYTLFERIDVLLIGAIVSTTAVGVFEAPLRLTNFLAYGGQAMAFGVAPRVARHAQQGQNVAAFVAATRYLILLQAALLAPVLVWSDPIVDLTLGSGYEESAEVLRALAPFMFLAALGTFITLGVNYLGEARRRVPLAIAAVLVNLVIDLILIPEIGVLGGAVGTDVAFALYVVGHFWICRDVLGFSLTPVMSTLFRSLVAAGAMCAVLAAFGTSSLSPLEALVGAALGITAYAALLVATGEVSRRELVDARSAVAAALRRARLIG
jgi:O-antigen/teichoic acid export membrane protein